MILPAAAANVINGYWPSKTMILVFLITGMQLGSGLTINVCVSYSLKVKINTNNNRFRWIFGETS